MPMHNTTEIGYPVQPTPWWATWWLAVSVSLALAVPLLRPAIPPLTDLFGHLARYAIVARIDTSPYFHQWFATRWVLSGNLGVDLIVSAIGGWLGIILATKLVVIATAVLNGVGMLMLAREAHGGRVPPTAVFALPLVFGMPFQYGFLNYSLSITMTFVAAALWIRLGRSSRAPLRAFVFMPIAIAIWVAHLAGWGMLCLILFAIETATLRRGGASIASAIWRAAIACLPIGAPIVVMLLQPAAPSTLGIAQWFDWPLKLFFLVSVLRDQNAAFDIASAVLLYGLAALAVLGIGFRMEPRLACAAGLVFGVFLLIPGMIMGSALADMRLLPCALALAILSLSPTSVMRRRLALLATAGIAFLGIRLAVQTIGWARTATLQQNQLAAIEHIPRGSRVFVLVTLPCELTWTRPRMDHLGLMAIVRRDAFVNGVWDMPSSSLTVHRPDTAGFVYAGSQTLFPRRCRYDADYDLPRALRTVPRTAFDFVWLIDTPERDWPVDGELRPVWSGNRTVLYRIAHAPSG